LKDFIFFTLGFLITGFVLLIFFDYQPQNILLGFVITLIGFFIGKVIKYFLNKNKKGH
jgi:hypothetical protein